MSAIATVRLEGSTVAGLLRRGKLVNANGAHPTASMPADQRRTLVAEGRSIGAEAVRIVNRLTKLAPAIRASGSIADQKTLDTVLAGARKANHDVADTVLRLHQSLVDPERTFPAQTPANRGIDKPNRTWERWRYHQGSPLAEALAELDHADDPKPPRSTILPPPPKGDPGQPPLPPMPPEDPTGADDLRTRPTVPASPDAIRNGRPTVPASPRAIRNARPTVPAPPPLPSPRQARTVPATPSAKQREKRMPGGKRDGEFETGWGAASRPFAQAHALSPQHAQEARRRIAAAAAPVFAAALKAAAKATGLTRSVAGVPDARPAPPAALKRLGEAPPSAPAGETVEAFAARFGRIWSERRGGTPTPAAMRDWLLKDHADVQAGARLRDRNVRKQPRSASELAALGAAVSRAWMTSRQQTMLFQLDRNPKVAPLGRFDPPTARPALAADPLIGGSREAPVTPMLSRFVREVKRRVREVDFGTYPRHGSQGFVDRGYSVDLFLGAPKANGFYEQADAIRLLRAVDEAAKAVGAEWRAIYNDFAVADAVNTTLGRRHVIYVGNVSRKNGKVTGLVWHGPAPLILHVHIDLTPRENAARELEAEAESEAGTVASTPRWSSRPRAQGASAATPHAAFVEHASRAFASELARLVGGRPPAAAQDIAVGAVIAAALAQANGKHPIVPPASVAPMAVLAHRALQPRLPRLARMAAVTAAAPAHEAAW